jgi:hypothetical protein
VNILKHSRNTGGDENNLDSPLFRPVKNNRTGTLDRHLDPGSIYRNIVSKYGREIRRAKSWSSMTLSCRDARWRLVKLMFSFVTNRGYMSI